MLELKNVHRDMTKYIARFGTSKCQPEDCEKCIIGRFNNEEMSCQEIAVKLLRILDLQKYDTTIPFHICSEANLQGWSKETLIKHIKELQNNYLTLARAFDEQSNIFIKFFTEQKGKMKITLEYKEK